MGSGVTGIARVRVGGVRLGDLAEGQWRALSVDEVEGFARNT